MKEWEYLVVMLKRKPEDTSGSAFDYWITERGAGQEGMGTMDLILSYFGRSGWELVTVTPFAMSGSIVTSYHCFFKRPC